MNRRRFLEVAGLICGGTLIGGCAGREDTSTAKGEPGPEPEPVSQDHRGKVFVGNHDDPALALEAAVTAAGGLAFIRKGDHVVLKPNVAWARTAPQAATTDPGVVGAMVRMCKAAGAGKVTVFEHTIDRPANQVMAMSGVGKAASEAGADIVLGSNESDYADLDIPRGKLLQRDMIAKTLTEADVIINMPKAKRHSGTSLTLGLKNVMGMNWNRQAWHTGPDLHQYIADYATAVPITLTVIDASRILMTNGPKGPGETKDPKQIIVSRDPVAGDAYACSLFDINVSDVPHIGKASELGLGESDITKITVSRA